jgi:DNA-binding MurR/RpiR family transcriptional regulator
MFWRRIDLSLQDIWDGIEAGYEGFSPQLKRGARFVRENPEEVALQSLRTVATRAGVSPASMTRLMQALGVASWECFQARHRNWLTGGRVGVFSVRADRLIAGARKPGSEDLLLDAISAAEQENVAAALEPSFREDLRRAATMVASAPAIAILGIRSCFPVAYSLHYTLSLFMRDVRLMAGTGGALHDDIHHLRKDDVLIVISVTPYSREVAEIARLATQAGVRLVAITDGPLSPVARLAEVTLLARNGSPAHIPTPIGPIAVAQALAALVLSRGGNDALEAMRQRELMLEALSAYLPEEKSE